MALTNADMRHIFNCSQSELRELKSTFKHVTQSTYVHGRPFLGHLASIVDNNGTLRKEMWREVTSADRKFYTMLSGTHRRNGRIKDLSYKITRAKAKILQDLTADERRRKKPYHAATVEGTESSRQANVSSDRRSGLELSPIPDLLSDNDHRSPSSARHVSAEDGSPLSTEHDPHSMVPSTAQRPASRTSSVVSIAGSGSAKSSSPNGHSHDPTSGRSETPQLRTPVLLRASRQEAASFEPAQDRASITMRRQPARAEHSPALLMKPLSVRIKEIVDAQTTELSAKLSDLEDRVIRGNELLLQHMSLESRWRRSMQELLAESNGEFAALKTHVNTMQPDSSR